MAKWGSSVMQSDKFTALVRNAIGAAQSAALAANHQKLTAEHVLAALLKDDGTSAFTKMVGAWCSENPKDSISKLKNNKNLDLSFCDSQPVSKQYIIGQKLGVNGTPAIFSMDGVMFPGYVEPEELLLKLKS